MLPSRRILDDRGNERRYIAAAHPDEDARLAARAFERKREEAARMGPPQQQAPTLWRASLADLARRARSHSSSTLPTTSVALLKPVGDFLLWLLTFISIAIAGVVIGGLVLWFVVLSAVIIFLPVRAWPLASVTAVVACTAIIVLVLAPHLLRIKSGPTRSGFAHLHSRLQREACPCCAYAYGDTPIEPDGCRVCSECGAAWRPLSPSEDRQQDPEHEYVDDQGRSLRDIEATEGRSALPDYGPPRPATLCEVLDLLGTPRLILPERVPQPSPLGKLGVIPTTRSLLLCILIAGLANIAMSRWLVLDPHRSQAFLPGSIMITLCLMLLAARRVARYVRGSRQARAWIAAKTCLACESPLTEASGCLRCPACGAAWAKPGAR